jgi:hypothetical protein
VLGVKERERVGEKGSGRKRVGKVDGEFLKNRE